MAGVAETTPRQPPAEPRLVLCNHGLRRSGGIKQYLLTVVDALHQRGQRPIIAAKRFDQSLPAYG